MLKHQSIQFALQTYELQRIEKARKPVWAEWRACLCVPTSINHFARTPRQATNNLPDQLFQVENFARKIVHLTDVNLRVVKQDGAKCYNHDSIALDYVDFQFFFDLLLNRFVVSKYFVCSSICFFLRHETIHVQTRHD